MSHEVLIDNVRYVPDQQPPGDLPEGYVSPHFRAIEFACNHCGALPGGVDQQLLVYLEQTRSHFGDKPITINSGYRCQTHNTNVGSTESSQHRHTPCWCADFTVSGVAPSSVYSYLDGRFPDRYGIGRYSSFTHFDLREGRARW